MRATLALNGLNLALKVPEKYHVFIINFKYMQHVNLLFKLLSLNKYLPVVKRETLFSMF